MIFSITNRLKGYIPVQLVFGRDIILLIKYEVDWGLLSQKNQAQINKDSIHKNRHRIEYNYRVGDYVILTNHTAYKYETPYKGPFLITHFLTNSTVNLQCGTKN